jgi:hypothetical protein
MRGTFSPEPQSFEASRFVRENAMEGLLNAVAFVGQSIEAVLRYIESHHWIFGLGALGYIFYLHDRAVHARFDELEKRLDEVRKRLALEY